MKKETHPNYRQILFVDSATGAKFLCGSTLRTNQTEMFEGQEYPVCYVPISSSSHPFFTDSKHFLDTEGRVDKFLKRYAVQPKPQKPQEESTEAKAPTKARPKVKKK